MQCRNDTSKFADANCQLEFDEEEGGNVEDEHNCVWQGDEQCGHGWGTSTRVLARVLQLIAVIRIASRMFYFRVFTFANNYGRLRINVWEFIFACIIPFAPAKG